METATTLVTAVGVGSGVISSSQGESIQRSAMAVSRSVESFTPEQEYYIGRTVGAVVLSKYPAYGNTPVNQYLNTLGQTLAHAKQDTHSQIVSLSSTPCQSSARSAAISDRGGYSIAKPYGQMPLHAPHWRHLRMYVPSGVAPITFSRNS
jgi:hypothetical protein